MGQGRLGKTNLKDEDDTQELVILLIEKRDDIQEFSYFYSWETRRIHTNVFDTDVQPQNSTCLEFDSYNDIDCGSIRQKKKQML